MFVLARRFGIFVLLLYPHCAYSDLVNQIVAMYSNHPVTLWDVHREIQIERIKQGLPPLQTVSLNDLKAMTKKMIVENLVVAEAKSFQVAPIEDVPQEVLLRKFKAQFHTADGYPHFLKTYGLAEADLKSILVRPLQVEQFLKEKIMSAYIYISSEEKEAYKRRYPHLSPDEVSDQLRKKKVKENLNDWIQGLKVRNEIQTFWD